MLFLQKNKKLSLHIVIALLIIVLQGFHTQVQAENADKRRIAESLWEEGKEEFSILSTTYFTITNKDQMSSGAKGYQKVLEKLNSALTIYRKIEDKQSEADLLTWMAAVKIEMGNYEDALNYMKESQRIYDKLNSGPGEYAFVKDVDSAMKTMALFLMGRSHSDAGDYESALKMHKTALKLVHEIGKKRKKRYEGGLLWEIGEIQLRLGNYSDAELYDRKVLAIFRELGKKDFEARMLCNMGRLYLAKHENSTALEYLRKALEIFEQFDDKNGIMAVLFLQGGIYYDQNDITKSLAFFKKAQKISQDVKYQEATAEIAEEIGGVYKGMGYLNIPVEHYKQALNIMQEIGNSPKEGDILYTIGQLYSGMGDYENALEALNKAMQIFKRYDDMRSYGETLVEIGKVNSKLGNYLEAIDNLQEALKIFEGIRDNDAIKKVALNTLGNVYRLLGDDETAKEYDIDNKGTEKPDEKNKWDQLSFLEKQAHYFIEKNKEDEALNAISRILDLSKKADDKVFERFCLSSIGFIYKFYLRNDTKALDYYKQALEVSRKHNDKAGELNQLLNIAGTYDYPWLSDYPNALKYYEQALVIAKEIGDKPSERECLSAIGEKYFQQKKYEKAEENFKNALFVSREMGAPEEIWDSQNKLGYLAYNTGQLHKAKSYYSEAINTIESIRGNISVEEYRTSFIEDKLLVYDFMILTLLELEEDEEAFNYVERAKSRSLLDLLGNKIRLKKGKNKELSQEEMKLQKKINELLEKIRKEHSIPKENRNAEMGVWNKELKQTRKQYAKHLLELKKENPELHSLKNVNPLTLKEVQKVLDPDTTLLVYYIIEVEYENTPVLYVSIWVIDKTKCEVVFGSLAMSTYELTSYITALREKIATLQPDYEEYTELFYDWLIGPAKPYIKTTRICIIPHSVLHYLPFHALRNIPEICGIGAVIDMIDGKLNVVSILEGSNVTQAGLKSGDKIIGIDDDATINMSLEEAVSRLRGQPYTTVLLTIEDGESKAVKKVVLKREIIAKSNDYSKFIVIDKRGGELKSPRFLIEEYDIFYAPSASVLKFVLEKRKKGSGSVLAFGNPEFADKDRNLPHAEEEVKRIKESYPETTFYLKEKATEGRAKSLSGNYDIIHFASHGELNSQSPLFSCIKMAKGMDEDGRLEVHEIFNLDLKNASLVTLSACETGLGKLSSGDELIGLTRGFIYAGTPSIVASLWNVNDKSTSDLMSLFYKNLKTHSKVEALRMAQLEMINGEVGRGIVRGVGGITTSKEGKGKSQTQMTVNGSHPYFWAPFILLGDWK